jgi:hypothetical protein
MNLVMIFSVLIAVEAVALLAVTFSWPPDRYSGQPRASIKRTATEAALLPRLRPVALTAR